LLVLCNVQFAAACWQEGEQPAAASDGEHHCHP
jgi:hypothetical protein